MRESEAQALIGWYIASTRMREILEAKECLGDPDRRLRYDRSIGIVRRTPGLRPEDI